MNLADKECNRCEWRFVSEVYGINEKRGNGVMVMKKFACVVASLLLMGCSAQAGRTASSAPAMDPSPAQTAVAHPDSPKPANQPIEATSEAAQVLLQFADLVTKGDAQGAANLLAPGERGIYQSWDYAPVRNTPRMEIVGLVETAGHPDVGGRDQKVAEARVFAVDVRYKVLGLINSDFKDGQIYHHKATVTRYTADGPWLISELSGVGN